MIITMLTVNILNDENPQCQPKIPGEGGGVWGGPVGQVVYLPLGLAGVPRDQQGKYLPLGFA